MTLSSSTLQEIIQAAQKATPGEWLVKGIGGLQTDGLRDFYCVAVAGRDVLKIDSKQQRRNNAAFVALSQPSVVLAMAEEILRMREGLVAAAKIVCWDCRVGRPLDPQSLDPGETENQREYWHKSPCPATNIWRHLAALGYMPVDLGMVGTVAALPPSYGEGIPK